MDMLKTRLFYLLSLYSQLAEATASCMQHSAHIVSIRACTGHMELRLSVCGV